MKTKCEVGFEYKGKVRLIDVLPVYKVIEYPESIDAEFTHFEVTIWNKYPQSMTATGFSIENALSKLKKALDLRPGFYDYEK